MNRDNKSLGFGIILVGVGFIILNIILLEKELALINPFYSFFYGISSSIVYLLNISANMKYLPVIIMYLPVIVLGVYYTFKEQNIKEGVSDTNLYFEYRQWNFFWGWFFDGKKEVQNTLNHYNSKGWKIVDFEWAKYFSHFGIFKTIAILYITILTLGVLSYWGGFFAIFEGVRGNNDKKKIDEKDVYEKYALLEWRKKNPDKSIYDYYVERENG
jgi:hypothetical protein